MVKYEVGKSFPDTKHRAPGIEIARTRFFGESFDVLLYTLSPQDDRDMVTKGPLSYGLYRQKDIPFFLLDFADGELTFDAPLNILKIDGDTASAWLNSSANAVNLYLIHAQTNILYGMRLIGLQSSLMEDLRNVLEKQDSRYETTAEVDFVTAAITDELTTDKMMKRATMYRL